MRILDNVIYDVLDVNTGEEVTYKEVTKWYDGSAMSDVKCDGILYRKLSSSYYLRVFEDSVKPGWFGAVGDGIVNDTVALQRMIDVIPSNITIDFGKRDYNFTTINLTLKRNIKFIGNGAIFRGTVIVGNTNPAASVFTDMNFSANGIRFIHTGFTKNCFEFCNMQGFELDNIIANGSNAVVYIRPIDKIQHVNRGGITRTGGESNYLVYADNPINTAPYTGLQMTLGDITIAGNSTHLSRINNFLGFGVDGAVVADNIFFMTGNFYRSQIKNQNIRVVGGNWISIDNNQMFEAGLEGCLLELCRNFTINNNRFAWSGQRDVNFGYGIRITGGGFPNVSYTNGTIENNGFDRCTRSNIKLDALCARLKVSNNQGTSTGAGQFYYGTSPYVNPGQTSGDPNALPAINSVAHYNVEVDANTKFCSAHDNTDDSTSYLFGYDETLPIGINERLIHYNNFGFSGWFEELPTIIGTIAADGKINTNGKNLVSISLFNGVIKDIVNARVGDKITLYNANASSLTIENNAAISLLYNRNAVIENTSNIVLQKRSDKWYEVSRSGVNGMKVFATSGADGVTPLIVQGNSASQTAPIVAVLNGLGEQILNVEPDGAFSLEQNTGAVKDFKFKRGGLARWIVRMNNTAESGGNLGSDLEFNARTDAGGFLGTVVRMFRSLNISIGESSDISSAKFAITSTDKGFLKPRLNDTQIAAVVSPFEGIEVYASVAKRTVFYNGTAWIKNMIQPDINTTNTVFTKTSLNGAYPNAKIGNIVIQDLTNRLYIKKDDSPTGNWSVIVTNGELA